MCESYNTTRVRSRIIQAINRLTNEKKVKSKAEIARKMEIIPQNFNEVLAGRNKITLEFIHNLCRATNVNVDFITKGESFPFYREGQTTINEKPRQTSCLTGFTGKRKIFWTCSLIG